MKTLLNEYELQANTTQNVDELVGQTVLDGAYQRRNTELPTFHVTATGGDVTVWVRSRNARNQYVTDADSIVVPADSSRKINVDYGADFWSVRLQAGANAARVWVGVAIWRK